MKKLHRHLFSLFFLIIFIILALGSEDESSSRVYKTSVDKYSKTPLNVRSGPSTNNKIIRTLKINEKVATYDTIVNGFTIILNKNGTIHGWAHNDYLQPKPLTAGEVHENIAQKKESQKQKQKTQKSTDQSGNIDSYSLGRGLAIVEKGGYVPENDLLVKRFSSLLNQLDNKYAESETEIADITVKAHRMLRDDYGIEESMVKIMEGLNTIFSLDQPNMKYKEYAASYVVMRKKGISHRETIENLTALLQALGIY